MKDQREKWDANHSEHLFLSTGGFPRFLLQYLQYAGYTLPWEEHASAYYRKKVIYSILHLQRLH